MRLLGKAALGGFVLSVATALLLRELGEFWYSSVARRFEGLGDFIESLGDASLLGDYDDEVAA